MIESAIFAVKALPVVFLAGAFLVPVSNVEDALIRTAAGVGALTVIWVKGIKPVYRWIADAIEAIHRTDRRIGTLEDSFTEHLSYHDQRRQEREQA